MSLKKMRTLHDAASTGDVAAVQRLLAAGAKPNVQDPRMGISPLTAAAEAGHADVVRLLLAAGADPNYLQTALFPLSAAAARGDVAMVQALLAAGANVDGPDEDNSTPLFDAAAGGHLDVVRVLLKAGANPRHKDDLEQTALSVAVENHRDAVVKLLLPLSSPAERKRVTAPPEPPTRKAAPAEKPTEFMKFYRAAQRGDRQTVEAMLEAGMPVDAVGEGGHTALMAAVGHLEIVRLLLEKGADLNRKNCNGDTALMFAVLKGDLLTFEHLYAISSPAARKKAEKQIRSLGRWQPREYPQWKEWEPPKAPERNG